MADDVVEPTEDDVARAVASRLDRSTAAVSRFEEGMNAVFRVSLVEGNDVVLKAGTFTEASKLLSGPVLLERLRQETDLSVPAVLAVVPGGDEYVGHAYFLMEYVAGRRTTDVHELPGATHERLVREAGHHLASIHDLSFDGPFGRLHASDGELYVGYEFDSWANNYASSVEYHVARLDARVADLEPAFQAAIEDFSSDVDAGSVDQSILYRDYHPKNLVFEPSDDADPIVRAIIDFNFRPVGDAPLDVAIAEANLIDLPIGGTNRAEPLRDALRNAYVEARGGSHEDHFDERYPSYRLVPVLDYLSHLEYFQRFGWEDDPECTVERLREFVRDRVTEIESGFRPA